MTRFLKIAVLGFGLICSTEVQAKCVCQCINGRMQSVCSNPGDTVPANCPMSACPMTVLQFFRSNLLNFQHPGRRCVRSSKGAAFVVRELSGLAGSRQREQANIKSRRPLG